MFFFSETVHVPMITGCIDDYRRFFHCRAFGTKHLISKQRLYLTRSTYRPKGTISEVVSSLLHIFCTFIDFPFKAWLQLCALEIDRYEKATPRTLFVLRTSIELTPEEFPTISLHLSTLKAKIPSRVVIWAETRLIESKKVTEERVYF